VYGPKYEYCGKGANCKMDDEDYDNRMNLAVDYDVESSDDDASILSFGDESRSDITRNLSEPESGAALSVRRLCRLVKVQNQLEVKLFEIDELGPTAHFRISL
jgi:hypothetical protein